MTRRITLPGADELFRATGNGPRQSPQTWSRPGRSAWPPSPTRVTPRVRRWPSPPRRVPRSGVRRTTRTRTRQSGDRQPSGRERHDEKITVYLSPEELVDLEQARLSLRQEHGLAVDRGRIVREALALVLAELEQRGDAATIVRRLRES